jgi:hypothetical protein
MPKSARPAIVALLLLAYSAQLRAQNFGEITGTVSDASGAVIAGANVTAKSSTTNRSPTSCPAHMT